jgi:serine kinase of HPr protein (carbohydrate metabolism regulator)
MSELLHGTFVAVDGAGVLLRGSSGSGKSDLALRLVSTPFVVGDRRPAIHLVSDDQVLLRRQGDRLIGTAPAAIRGQIEVRGIGIVRIAHLAEAPLELVIELAPASRIERLPCQDRSVALLGVEVPLAAVDPFEASAPLKVLMALNRYPMA